jgi:glutathione S-transferase|nr:glutathione transferase [Kofleriaceae bacterium]
MSTELVLHADSKWESPWVFHALVALEEKGLPYRTETTPLPVPEPQRTEWLKRGVVAKVPMLVHGELWLGESSAISEYLAETFPSTQGYPRLFPADLKVRARSRQVMSMLRTSLAALREARPTSSVFGKPTTAPMSDKARAEAAELVRIAAALVSPRRDTMFDAWCIADADLSLALMRLVANNDHVPAHLVDYAQAQWQRASVRKFLSNVPTQRL